MFTHAENLALVFFGAVQGGVIAAVATSRVGLPDWIVLIASLAGGMVLAAVEFSFIFRIVEKLRGKKRG